MANYDRNYGFLVQERRPCECCEATGIVQNSYWQQFFELYTSAKIEYQLDAPAIDSHELACKQFDKFWHERGYNCDWRLMQVSELPPEEEQCFECEGKGYLEREAKLWDALKELGVVE